MNQQPDVYYKRGRALWSQLRSRFGDEFIEGDALDRAILECMDGYQNDFGMAHAMRATLANAGALVVRQGDKPRTYTYQLTDTFPEWVDYGPGSPAYNEYLRKQHEWTLAELERERQRAYESSPAAIERQMMERFVNERIEKALAPLRDELHALREQIAVTNLAA